MKANELRVGNYVIDTFDLRLNEIVKLELDDFSVMYNFRKSSHPIPYQPVKLTLDWVIKFGFYETSKYLLFAPNFDISLFKRDEDFIFMVRDCRCKIIKYVHELQNIYFDITGEELIETKS